jgi:hypothetical protein
LKLQNKAVVYPLLPEHIERLLKGKDVFCKYVGEKPPSVSVGGKLIFYQSGGGKCLVGEATIDRIEFMTPDTIMKEFRDRLFITPDELNKYRGDRPESKMLLVLLLSQVRRYETPVKPPKVVTMAGCTLSRDQYRKLTSHIMRDRGNSSI